MKNNRFACNHRVGARITDGQYYTLLNKANFLGMSVNDYIIKCCGLVDVPAQTEFKYYVINGEEVGLDETPQPVQQGHMTLQEYYELEEEINMHNKAEDMEEEVNKLYNRMLGLDNKDYKDEESGRIIRGKYDDPNVPLCVHDSLDDVYDTCIRAIAHAYRQSGITYEMLRAHITTDGSSFIMPE